MPDRRQQQLARWIGSQLNVDAPQLEVVSGDASFRRYFRFKHQNRSLIAVDAPPEHENNAAFVSIGKLLREFKIVVPEFFQVDFEQGFLLLSDLGDRLLLPELNAATVDGYYQQAISTLLNIQQIPLSRINQLPRYDIERLTTELNLCREWFIARHLQLKLSPSEEKVIDEVFHRLIESALQQPQVLVHRDFHSRNLMVTDTNDLAVIDFQDAVVGPLSYDLVSLLKDCYIKWPEPQVEQWVASYFAESTQLGLTQQSLSEFLRQFDWMGMQRHIKVLGIFARLNYRDNKPTYLSDLPLTFDYLLKAAARYPQFDEFYHLLTQTIQPALEARL